MILDARTMLLLFVDALSAALLLGLCALAWLGHRRRAAPLALEELGHLAALGLGALLALRVVAWGLFFLVLDGYVPAFRAHGVMCAFGVVELRPGLARAALWAQPAALALLCAWWALAAAERGVAGAPFLRARFAALWPCAAAVAVALALEARWLASDKLESLVTCCRASAPGVEPLAWVARQRFLGLAPEPALALVLGLLGALAGASALFARAGTGPWRARAVLLALAACALAPPCLAAWRELVAPRALGLPFHRCAYELVTQSFALGPAALAAALAHLAAPALALLALVEPREPAGARAAARRIAAWLALAWASELVVLAVHVA